VEAFAASGDQTDDARSAALVEDSETAVLSYVPPPTNSILLLHHNVTKLGGTTRLNVNKEVLCVGLCGVGSFTSHTLFTKDALSSTSSVKSVTDSSDEDQRSQSTWASTELYRSHPCLQRRNNHEVNSLPSLPSRAPLICLMKRATQLLL
jgi:hypothetical protein